MANRWQENYQLYKRYLRSLAAMYQKRQDVHLFVELLLSLSVIAIFGAFAIKPTLVTISDLNNQIAGKKETVAQLDAKIQALSEAQNVYQENLSAILLLNSSVPQNPEPEKFIRQVEGLAKRNSVLISSLDTSNLKLTSHEILTEEVDQSPSAEGAAVDYFPAAAASFELETNFNGVYDQLIAFLREFENLRRPMYIDTITFRSSSEELSREIALSIMGRLSYLPNE